MSKRKTLYEQLEKIHPDLKWVEFDGFELTLRFNGGSSMTKQEFASNSETWKLVDEIEHLLLVV